MLTALSLFCTLKSLKIVKLFDIVKILTSGFMYKLHMELIPSVFSNNSPLLEVSIVITLDWFPNPCLHYHRLAQTIKYLVQKSKAQKLTTNHSNLVASQYEKKTSKISLSANIEQLIPLTQLRKTFTKRIPHCRQKRRLTLINT